MGNKYKLKGIYSYSSQYSALMEIYEETGLFLFLSEAYMYCRENKLELPEELLSRLDKHFKEFSNAKTQQEGFAAFCFDSNKKGAIKNAGGAWQNRIAEAKWNQRQILSLCDDMLVLTAANKAKVFLEVSIICNTSIGHVKNLYYKNNRK